MTKISEVQADAQTANSVIQCPLCGMEQTTTHFEKIKLTNLAIITCMQCGMKLLDPASLNSNLPASYEKSHDLNYERFRKAHVYVTYVQILKQLGKLKSLIYSKLTGELRKSGKRLLEINPGNGLFLSIAKEKGWETEGREDFEASDIKTEYYDALCLWEVLDRTYYPLLLLHRCFETIKAGGRVVISVYNDRNLIRFLGLGLSKTYGRNGVLYFTPATLLSLILHFGFSIEQIYHDYYDPSLYTTNPVVRCLLTLAHWSARPFKLTDRFVVIARKKVDVGH